MLRNIIKFISDKNPDTMYGLTQLSILMLCQGVSFFIREHMTLYQRMTGYKATNAIIAMILEKQFKISPATNKTFTAGEMINFVQVDSAKIVFMVGYMSQVTTFPFMLIFCTAILFYYLHWSFMSAIVIFAITFYVNFLTGKRGAEM